MTTNVWLKQVSAISPLLQPIFALNKQDGSNALALECEYDRRHPSPIAEQQSVPLTTTY